MAIEPIFADAAGRQITYTELCRDIIGVTPRANVNSLMALNYNMFAKYKIFFLPNGKLARESDFWKGTDGKCGINIPQLASLDEIGKVNWTLNKALPRNPIAHAALSDLYFWGRYNRNARPFLSTHNNVEYEYNQLYNAPYSIRFDYEVGDETQLGIFNFPFLADFHFAACIGKSPSRSRVVMAEGTISKMGVDISFSAEYMMSLQEGLNYIYCFLMSEADFDRAMKFHLYFDANHPNPIPFKVSRSAALTGMSTSRYTDSIGGTWMHLHDTPANPVRPTKYYFEIVFSNPTSSEKTIRLSDLRLSQRVWSSPGGSEDITGRLVNWMGDENWTTVNELRVASHAEKRYILEVNFSANWNPSTVTIFDAEWTLYQARGLISAYIASDRITIRYGDGGA